MIILFKCLILAFLFSNLSCGLEERKITVEYIAQTQAQIDSAVSKLNVNDSVFYEDVRFLVNLKFYDYDYSDM